MAPVNEPRFVLIGTVPTSYQAPTAPALQMADASPSGPQQQPEVISIAAPKAASALASSSSPSSSSAPPSSSSAPPPPPPSFSVSPPPKPSDNMPPKKKKGPATAGISTPAAKRPVTSRPRPNGGPAKSKKSKKAAAAATASRKLKKTAASHSRGNEENVDPEQQRQQQQQQQHGEADPDPDSDEDNGPYCVCRGPDDHTFMIACEICDEWFHGRCVNLEKDVGETLVSRFICSPCEARTGHKTQYLLTCSYDNCRKPARLYATSAGLEGKAVPLKGDDVARRSGFCSDEHRDVWWSRLLRKVPARADRDAAPSAAATGRGRGLAREEMLALLAGRLNVLDDQGDWKLLKQPFSAGDACEDWMLTPEETSILDASQRQRDAMADDLKLSQRMLHLLEMAHHRRRAAISAKLLNEDQCGYDTRLDSVGAKAAFRTFINSREGAAIFERDELGDPILATTPTPIPTPTPTPTPTSASIAITPTDANAEDVVMASDDTSNPANPVSVSTNGMCDRKRCKAHHGWHRLLSRTVKMQMREMRAATEARLAREDEVRSAAVGRRHRMAVDPGEVVLENVAAGA